MCDSLTVLLAIYSREQKIFQKNTSPHRKPKGSRSHSTMVKVGSTVSTLARPLIAASDALRSVASTWRGGRVHNCNAVEPITHRFVHRRSESTQSSSSSTSSSERYNPDILLLEGDAFAVSHDGIARTGYHLLGGGTPILTVEEVYDLGTAHKEFIVRKSSTESWTTQLLDHLNRQESLEPTILGKQAIGIAPLGDALGSIEIQEIDEGVFGRAGTGATTWEASIAMALFFASNKNPNLFGGNVLELGCGVGLGQLLTLLSSTVSGNPIQYHIDSVTLTDGNPDVIQQCRRNVETFRHSFSRMGHNIPPFHVRLLQWEQAKNEQEKYDSIIACDVAYLYTQVAPLTNAIAALMHNQSVAHLFGPYNRGALQEVCRVLSDDKGLRVDLEFIELDRYRLKPASQSKSISGKTDGGITEHRNSYESKSEATFLHATFRFPDQESQVSERANRTSNGIHDID